MKRILLITLILSTLLISGCSNSYDSCYKDCIEIKYKDYDTCFSNTIIYGCDNNEQFYNLKDECNKRCSK